MGKGRKAIGRSNFPPARASPADYLLAVESDHLRGEEERRKAIGGCPTLFLAKRALSHSIEARKV